jgi:hypothetical protein
MPLSRLASTSAGLSSGMSVGAASVLGGGGASSLLIFMFFGTTGAAAGGLVETLGGLGFTSAIGLAGGGASTFATSSTNFTSTSRSLTIWRVPKPISVARIANATYRTDEVNSARNHGRDSWSTSP